MTFWLWGNTANHWDRFPSGYLEVKSQFPVVHTLVLLWVCDKKKKKKSCRRKKGWKSNSNTSRKHLKLRHFMFWTSGHEQNWWNNGCGSSLQELSGSVFTLLDLVQGHRWCPVHHLSPPLHSFNVQNCVCTVAAHVLNHTNTHTHWTNMFISQQHGSSSERLNKKNTQSLTHSGAGCSVW